MNYAKAPNEAPEKGFQKRWRIEEYYKSIKQNCQPNQVSYLNVKTESNP